MPVSLVVLRVNVISDQALWKVDANVYQRKKGQTCMTLQLKKKTLKLIGAVFVEFIYRYLQSDQILGKKIRSKSCETLRKTKTPF